MSEKVEPYMDDERLVKSVLTTLHKPCKNPLLGEYLWARVRDLFCVGSTSAKLLCERFGFDPDTKVRKVFRGDRN